MYTTFKQLRKEKFDLNRIRTQDPCDPGADALIAKLEEHFSEVVGSNPDQA